MVLEAIIGPAKAEKSPWELFLLGFLYATLGLFLAFFIFEKYASLVSVFLTVIASLVLFQKTLRFEEKKAMKTGDERKLMREHSRALAFLMLMFIGFVAAYTIWYIVLPDRFIQTLFGVQTETIVAINTGPSSTTSAISSSSALTGIFFNNFKVLLFSLLFAFFYSAGAMVILPWNASVVGTAIGIFFRTELAKEAKEVGAVTVAAHFATFSVSLLRYLTHGLFEILAYFMAALGAGIISIAVTRHDFGSEKFKQVLVDSLDLIILSILILIFAALIEVFVTPVLF